MNDDFEDWDDDEQSPVLWIIILAGGAVTVFVMLWLASLLQEWLR